MNCSHCATPATRYEVTKEDGQTSIVHECDGCHRRRVPLIQPATGAVTWWWMPKSGYCADCRHPIWRFASDPQSGQPVLLWPGPEVVSAQFTHESGGLSQPVDYCADCLPALAAPPSHILTNGGTPIAFGNCAKHLSAADRYAAWFTDERGAFYEAWGRDHLMLDDTHHPIFMAQWRADRAAIFNRSDEQGGESTPAGREHE